MVGASPRRIALGLAIALGLTLAAVISLAVSATASPGTPSHASDDSRATAFAAKRCSQLYIQKLPIKVFQVDDPAWDYRVQGGIRVKNLGRTRGCAIKVCEAEELGAGNWVGLFCTNNVIGRNERLYFSGAPYVDCETYKGTGYFRSYARFEGSSLRSLGPVRKVC